MTVDAQRPVVEVRTPGLVRRGLAALFDLVPALTLAGAATLALPSWGDATLPPSRWNALDRVVDVLNAAPGRALGPAAVALGVLVAWHLVGTLAWGGSPGKRLLALRIVGPDGRRPGLARALVHALLRAASLLGLGIGHLWWLADPERRTLYDRLAGVRVVVGDPPAPRPR
ncbi:MAG: RDD family protein [Myxococcota bacterium]